MIVLMENASVLAPFCNTHGIYMHMHPSFVRSCDDLRVGISVMLKQAFGKRRAMQDLVNRLLK